MDKQDPRDEFAQTFDNEVAIDNEQVNPEDLAQLELQKEQPPQEETNESQEAATQEAPAPTATEEPAPPAIDLEKEIQRLKSWEGRLKAREAELKERETKPANSEEGAQAAATEAVEQAAQDIAEGKPSDKAFATLQDEFGEDFANAIAALVTAKIEATQAQIGSVSKQVENVISALRNDRQREHFEMIAERHPDFMVVAESKPFQEWIEAQGEEAQNTVNAGSARQVCALLDKFKEGQQAGDPAQSTEEAAKPEDMAAIAVTSRSAGLRLPTKPATSDDYLSAWDEA